jgi:thiol-disulfide isomerase/thioredoxin
LNNNKDLNKKIKLMITKKTLIVIFIATIFLISCNTTKKETITGGFTTIKGTYDLSIPWPPKEVKLSKIEYGKNVEVGVYKLKADKKYGFTIAMEEEGFYVLSSDYNHIPLYIKGNQVFNVDITANKYIQHNIPDEENKVLYKYMQLADTLGYYRNFSSPSSPTYKKFFPFYEKFIPKMKAFHEEVKTSNKKFNELMHAYVDLDIEEQALNFLYTPRAKHPTADQRPSFYNNFMETNKLNTTKILDLPKGIRALRSHDMYYLDNVLKIKMEGSYAPSTREEAEAQTDADREDYRKRYAAFMKKRNANIGSSIKNDTLKAFFILEELPRFKALNKKYIDFMKPFREAIELSDYVKGKVEEHEAKIRSTGAGSPGAEFICKDINDKEVSFSDLKGKYIYIDVWAMWCSPCKQEIPHLKKLEKAFKGKNIHFVSISMDKPKDLKKWKKFVKDNKLTGIQLFADNAFESKIAKDYKINSIPRFLLFDKAGLIIDADAKRPSDPELKKILKNLLK